MKKREREREREKLVVQGGRRRDELSQCLPKNAFNSTSLAKRVRRGSVHRWTWLFFVLNNVLTGRSLHRGKKLRRET